MAERIKAIDFENDVAPQYEDLLSPAEIKGAADRFEALRNHIAKLEEEGCIVDDWTTWRSRKPSGLTATDFLIRGAEGQDSLFTRDLAL